MTEQSTTSPARPEASRHAITAMVFAVSGLFWLVIVGPVLALVYADKARRQLDEDPAVSGRELAASARTVAVVGLALQGVALVVGLAVAITVAVTADKAIEGAGRSNVPAAKDAGRAFTDLCQHDLNGDSGGCGCALANARDAGVTDTMLALDVAEYRATGTVPEEIAGPLRRCGVEPEN